jgi:hypothetical protein
MGWALPSASESSAALVYGPEDLAGRMKTEMVKPYQKVVERA